MLPHLGVLGSPNRATTRQLQSAQGNSLRQSHSSTVLTPRSMHPRTVQGPGPQDKLDNKRSTKNSRLISSVVLCTYFLHDGNWR